MKKYIIPNNINYIGVFLTLRCSLGCSYCLNKIEKFGLQRSELPSSRWIKALSRIATREDLPITLQGGEPTEYKDFYNLVNMIPSGVKLDLLTNGKFNVYEFCENVKPSKFKRNAPYASIRFSYHPMRHNYVELLSKVNYMQSMGYSVGVWAVDYPDKDTIHKIGKAEILAKYYNIDFRHKEYLGTYKGKMMGTYKYPEGLNNKDKECWCTPSEILIGPDGKVYRCHRDLYTNTNDIGHIDKIDNINYDIPRYCSKYGWCNPCDVKLKTNRLQEFGHASVTIEEIQKSSETVT